MESTQKVPINLVPIITSEIISSNLVFLTDSYARTISNPVSTGYELSDIEKIYVSNDSRVIDIDAYELQFGRSGVSNNVKFFTPLFTIRYNQEIDDIDEEEEEDDRIGLSKRQALVLSKHYMCLVSETLEDIGGGVMFPAEEPIEDSISFYILLPTEYVTNKFSHLPLKNAFGTYCIWLQYSIELIVKNDSSRTHSFS